MSDDPIIHVENLTRSYGSVVALNEVSIDLKPGVVGLLGPNGAGKSTLLRILTGELRPTIGSVTVLGMEPFANPDLYHRIGICPEQEAMFDDMTGVEFVSFLLRMRGWSPPEAASRTDEWIERVGLVEARGRRIRGYSKGMRQRIKICTAFAHDPDLLLLDEPLTGLDPLWRHKVQRMVADCAERGATVLFSSHVLHEVEAVTRDVMLLHRGRIAAEGNAREIRALIDQHPHRIRILAEEPRRLAVHLMQWDCVESVCVTDTGVRLTTPKPEAFYSRMTDESADGDLGVRGMESPDDCLQSLFDTLVLKRPVIAVADRNR